MQQLQTAIIIHKCHRCRLEMKYSDAKTPERRPVPHAISGILFEV